MLLVYSNIDGQRQIDQWNKLSRNIYIHSDDLYSPMIYIQMIFNNFAKVIQWKKIVFSKVVWGNSLAVQWLGLHTSTAGGTGSIPGWGTKIPQAAW